MTASDSTNKTDLLEWIPTKRVGPFVFGERFEIRYGDLTFQEADFDYKAGPTDNTILYIDNREMGINISVCKDIVYAINFHKNLYFNGVDIIGKNFESIWEFFCLDRNQIKIDPEIYDLNEYNFEGDLFEVSQMVYEVDVLEAQFWVSLNDKKIISVDVWGGDE